MYELSRKQFVFFFVFSDYGRVVCTHKRIVDKGFCQSTAYRSKLTAKLQFTAAKSNI